MALNLEEKDISISHRLPSNAQQNQSYSSRLRPREGSALNKVNLANQFPNVIAKFARRGTKNQFYHDRKHLKNKSTKDIRHLKKIFRTYQKNFLDIPHFFLNTKTFFTIYQKRFPDI